MWRSDWRTTPAWVETWKSHLVAGADHELGRAAADVDDERRLAVAGVALARGPEERQAGLVIALEHVGLEPEPVADGAGELLAVGGVADRAGEHRHRALAPVALDRSWYSSRTRVHPLHRLSCEAAAGIDACAEARDVRLARRARR